MNPATNQPSILTLRLGQSDQAGQLAPQFEGTNMKATEANLLQFIQRSPQFKIPIYQRSYSWSEKECHQLWNDILRAGNSDSIKAHFMGSVVYIQEGLYQVTTNAPLLVIDGQQRLTTITLLLAALAEALKQRPDGECEPLDGFSPRKLRN